MKDEYLKTQGGCWKEPMRYWVRPSCKEVQIPPLTLGVILGFRTVLDPRQRKESHEP